MSEFEIRVAIWIIRLKPIIDHLSPKLMIDNEPLPFTYPVVIAWMYSIAEKAYEILGEDFDSSDLDNALFAGDFSTLSKLVNVTFSATSRPCLRNHNCKSCDHLEIPGTKMCIPKRKEGAK